MKIPNPVVGTLSAFALAALPAAAGTAVLAAGPAAAARTAAPQSGAGFRHACDGTPAPGWAECLALVRTGAASFAGLARAAGPAGYGPADLRSAYGLTLAAAAAGKGETVAVVDAYDDPDAAADLAVYRARYHLPACGAGCFVKVNQEGRAGPLPRRAGTSGWATEESLDIDMVSAICPNCRILLVEADNGSVANLGAGVNSAVSLGARFVSNSYSAPQAAADGADDAAYFDHPGAAVTAAAGDSGYGVGYPAASRYVTAVGGTSLVRDSAAARGWRETVWDNGAGATGSGCSAREPKPSWQTDSGCPRRTDNDVAADANPSTGAAVYDSYDQGGWLEAGGTSEAAPIIAATYALAGPPASGTYPAQYLYQHHDDLYDITSGSDGSCGGSYLCTAKAGYDGPTGWGTPDGTGAFRATDNSVTVIRPANRVSIRGEKITPLRITAKDSRPRTALRFTARGLPRGLSISAGGVISGTPRVMGYYRVRVHATDATGTTGSATLRWTVESVGAIRALGRCLDDFRGGTEAHNKIDIVRCDGGKSQIWLVDPHRGGALQIRLAKAIAMCLTVPGSRPGTGAALQRCGSSAWKAGQDGHLVSLLSGLCLADPGAGRSGARLEAARCADSPSQRWSLP